MYHIIPKVTNSCFFFILMLYHKWVSGVQSHEEYMFVFKSYPLQDEEFP